MTRVDLLFEKSHFRVMSEAIHARLQEQFAAAPTPTANHRGRSLLRILVHARTHALPSHLRACLCSTISLSLIYASIMATPLPTLKKYADAPEETRATGTHGFFTLRNAKDANAVWGLSTQSVTNDSTNDHGRMRSSRVGYLESLRGLVGISGMLWAFFRILAPGE